MTVVALHKPKPSDDVIVGLRGLADRIERGEIGWPVTTAVVVLGHTDAERPADDQGVMMQQNHWSTFGYGPRCDSFTVRGLLATVIHDDWGSGG